jgi:hypothetical protein
MLSLAKVGTCFLGILARSPGAIITLCTMQASLPESQHLRSLQGTKSGLDYEVCSLSRPHPCCAVIDGMDIVKKIEGVGSGDGKPSKAVHIADSGELGAGSATA